MLNRGADLHEPFDRMPPDGDLNNLNNVGRPRNTWGPMSSVAADAADNDYNSSPPSSPAQQRRSRSARDGSRHSPVSSPSARKQQLAVNMSPKSLTVRVSEIKDEQVCLSLSLSLCSSSFTFALN
jgi:hypothetical protein